MNKKILAISVIAVFICLTVMPTNVGAGLIFKFQGKISVDFEENNEPLIPEESRTINLTLNYFVERGIFGKNILKLHSGKEATVKLEVAEISPWLTATMLTDAITFPVSEETQSKYHIISIQANLDAPAYETGIVKIKATAEPIKGPFGIRTIIKGEALEFDIKINIGAFPLIKLIPPENTTFEITPFNQTIIPIEIDNLGNAKTDVIAKIVNKSKDWDISIDDLVIDINKTGKTYLVITADNKFDEETIEIEFTPAEAKDPANKGTAEYLSIVLINDGSYVEEDELGVDLTILLIVAIIIILVIAVLLLLRRRKQ